MKPGYFLGFIGIFASCHSLSNDSIGRIASGGIELLNTADIQMKKEILEISPDNINVKYEFLNKTEKDIKTTIAFPMPAYGFAPGFSVSEQNFHPIQNFKVTVNQLPINTQSTFKALLNGKDITKLMRNSGLNDKQIFEDFSQCHYLDEKSEFNCKLTPVQQRQLADIGAIELTKGKNPFPRWDVEQTEVWTQIFPAREILVSEHSYTPLTGGIYAYPLLENKPVAKYGKFILSHSEDNEACLDEDFENTIQRRVNNYHKHGAKTVMLMLDDIEYVLGTGRNWAGPIEDFTLRLKKKSADQLVSLCFPGKPKKIDALTIEFNQKNFIPQDKLVVYFYSFRIDEQ